MAKKGENIYKRKDGRWEGRYANTVDINGKKKYKSVYGKSYKEVKNKLIEYKKNIDTESVCKIDFNQAANEWLHRAELRVKKSTYANYAYLLQKHIIPFFNGKHMNKLSVHDIDAFINEKLTNGRLKRNEGISKKYLRDMISIVKAIAVYCELEYNISNRIRYIHLPKLDKKETDILDDDDYNKLQEYIKSKKNVYSLAILLAMFTGLRLGEICGLRWEDCDFNNKILNVKRTAQRIRDGQGSTVFVISSPKTSTSARSIPLPDFICDALKKYQREAGLPVFSDTNEYTEPSTIRKYFYKLLDNCGIKRVRFHDLRHSFASKCLRVDFDIKSLSEILGHSSAAMTLNCYAHSTMKLKRKFMERLK